ncbi:restriction endonuclease [Pseudomonas sp. DTU12.3]|uniref:restriction endonuclease n=1 Tax=Pseudomonas sp. DTU12.3 TaxID=2073078 RepID=UPI0010105279|nr:restriction endonuclease [Pseudomonas sp. DTU12.3]QAX86444.1 restriction endonuclease [Pseudomonas sp. DTU12.3]
MTDNLVYSVDELSSSDLMIDARYAGSRNGNSSDDPLTKLLNLSNQGGFRIRGKRNDPRLIALLSSMEDLDWPDELDLSTGVFTYYGDNKKPGRKLDETHRYGNNLLELIFERQHSGDRADIPPIFVFTKAGIYRDVIFRGLAVPGRIGSTHNDDLVAVWHASKGQRFQNYRATFTILDLPEISRDWLTDIINGMRASDSEHAPLEWMKWVRSGQYTPLIAKRSQPIRSKKEQLPSSKEDMKMLSILHKHFESDPYAFEACAAHLVRVCLPDTVALDLTRRYRDGGRDGTGKLRIGRPETSVLVDFAIEAKCYGIANSVGVREVSRLISRLRHRQFGVIITTSWLHDQAYKEIVEDGHPVMILAGRDIVELLRETGLQDSNALTAWLNMSFPLNEV